MGKKIVLIFVLLFVTTSCRSNVDRFMNGKILGGKNNFYTDDIIAAMLNDTDKIRVGLLLPLSGAVKSVGETLLNTAQLSIFNNNKKNIILKIYDTNGTTFGAVKAANKAVADGVDLIIGPLFSAETKAIRNIVKKNDLLLFSLSNDQSLANISNVFVTGSIPEQEIQLLISYLIGSDIHNYVSFLPNNEHGAEINKILRAAITGKDGLLIKSDYYDEGDQGIMTKLSDLTNYYEIPQTIYDEYQKKKAEQKLLGYTEDVPFVIKDEEKIYPQCVFVADGGKRAEELARLMFIIQNSGSNLQFVGTSKFDGDNNILNNPYMNGVIFVGADPKKLDKFYKDYNEIYRQDPIKISSMLYDLINIVDYVYKKTKNGRYLPDKKALLDPFGFDGIDGRFRFLPNGIVERNMFVLQILDKKKVVLYNAEEFLNY
jgi:ABC-type branched-subunit amino acid transport system substrate-binding protein